MAGGHKAWEARWHTYNTDGLRVRHKRRLGNTAGMGREAAQRLLEDLMDEINDRLDPDRTGIPSNKARTGCIGEMVACLDLMRQGYEVYKAVNPQSSFDLVAVMDGQMKRVEVKVCEPDRAGFIRQEKILNKEGKFDLLAIVTKSGRVIYQTHDQALEKSLRIRSLPGPAGV